MTAVVEPSYRKRPAYHGALLGSMALLASAVLVIGFMRTKDDIASALLDDTKASLSQVIPPELHNNDLTADTLEIASDQEPVLVYQARMGDSVVAVAYEVVGPGYAGPISAIMAVAGDGTLLGVRVISHLETPGLGDKIEEKKDSWILQFSGLSFSSLAPEKWGVKKDGGHFDQFTGATITPRGLIKAIKGGMLFFQAHRDELLRYTPSVTLPEQTDSGDGDPPRRNDNP